MSQGDPAPPSSKESDHEKGLRLSYLRAAREGDLRTMKSLEPMVPVDVTESREHRSALHLVALAGHLEIVEHLLRRGHATSQTDYRQWTPAACAAAKGNIACLKRILEAVATSAKGNADLVDSGTEAHRYTSYFTPTPDPRESTTNFFQRVAEEIEQRKHHDFRWQGKESAATLYDAATESFSMECLEAIDSMGYKVKYANRGHNRLVGKALQNCQDQHLEQVLDWLIDRGAIITTGQPTDISAPAVDLARRNDTRRLDLAYLEKPRYFTSGLIEIIGGVAAGNNAVDALDWARKKGFELDHFRQDGTLLHVAVRDRSDRLLEYLLHHELPIDAFDGEERTPLHLAAIKNNTFAARLLISHGANIHAGLPGSASPAHLAVGHTSTGVFLSLLESGFDVDREGDTFKSIRSFIHETPPCADILHAFEARKLANEVALEAAQYHKPGHVGA